MFTPHDSAWGEGEGAMLRNRPLGAVINTSRGGTWPELRSPDVYTCLKTKQKPCAKTFSGFSSPCYKPSLGTQWG